MTNRATKYQTMFAVSMRNHIGMAHTARATYPIWNVRIRPRRSESAPPQRVKISHPNEASVVASSTGGRSMPRPVTAYVAKKAISR